uniref:Uncharacterized protein n=1 Tax=Lactuca sativa TaxID=4236 RepID=A0A9R1X2J9_LACSA|nr:hypothetical protein LSAT_V11C700378160 [Lactuca sativa]
MAIFISIKVHFQCVFISKPFCYSDGIHHVFENIDFTGMSYTEFVGFLERFTQDNLISNELQYQYFIDITYRCGVQLPVYMDHFGTTVHVTKENENKDNCFVISNMSFEGEQSVELTEFVSPQQSNMEVIYEGVSQENGNEDATEGEKPKDDEDDNVPDVENDNVPDVKGKPMFNEDISWTKQLPILVVNYRWIGSHFTREVLENQKFNVRMLKEEVKTKFSIDVSMGQNRRAKQHAVSLVEGAIVETYANPQGDFLA